MPRSRETYWYALKVFYGRTKLVEEDFRKARYTTFIPMKVEEVEIDGHRDYVEKPLITSLMFVRCTERFLKKLKIMYNDYFLYYSEPGERAPGRIPDKEMDNFRLATTLNTSDVMYMGSDTFQLRKGDRIRVRDGLYKGLEGYVRRINHSRKVLVCLEGIAVVAVSNIHPHLLEKID